MWSKWLMLGIGLVGWYGLLYGLSFIGVKDKKSVPKHFDDLYFITVKNYKTHWAEKFLLGEFDRFGYRNEVNSRKRALTAAWLTSNILLGMALLVALCVFALRSVGLPVEAQKNAIGQEAFVGLLLVVFGSFGTILWRERKDVHEKWLYLASCFNQVLATDPPHFLHEYNKREHMAASLAFDIFLMQMWAHKGLQSLFVEVIRKAVWMECQGDQEKAKRRLDGIVKNGLDYADANRLLSDYIGLFCPESEEKEFVLAASKRACLARSFEKQG